MMILLNDLIEGTATAVPEHIQRLFKLADQALMTEGDLEELPQDDPRCDPIERVERIWRKACERTARRVDALEAALQAYNDEEVLLCWVVDIDDEPLRDAADMQMWAAPTTKR